MFFLMFLFLFGVSDCSSICKLKFENGDKVDLRKIPLITVSFILCGGLDHSIFFQLCDDLDDRNCPSFESRGPGNACDFDSTSYFWVGGVNGFTLDETTYSKNGGKEFILKYEGIIQNITTPNIRRSLEVQMVCDESKEKAVGECVDFTYNVNNDQKYKVKVTSKEACKVTEKSNSVITTAIVTASIVGSLSICCFFVCFSVFVSFLCICGVFCTGFCCGTAPKGYLKLGGDGFEDEDEDEEEEDVLERIEQDLKSEEELEDNDDDERQGDVVLNDSQPVDIPKNDDEENGIQ